MNILVTGCAGFIASHLCKKLIEKGNQVYGIDNLDPFYDLRMKNARLDYLSSYDNFYAFKQDINNTHKTDLIFANYDFDGIIHIGARAGVRTSLKLPISYIRDNIEATNRLLEHCITNDISKFIFASSSSVYGNVEPPFREDMELKPIAPYAASKLSCEIYGATYSRIYEINFTALRFFTVYGPGQRTDMSISRFVKWIDNYEELHLYGDGSYLRDFTYVTDIIDGIVKAFDKGYKNEVINLGNGNPISINDLISIIEKSLGKKATIKNFDAKKGDMKVTNADISKAEKLLAYEPKIGIEEGIKKYIEWYKKKTYNSLD